MVFHSTPSSRAGGAESPRPPATPPADGPAPRPAPRNRGCRAAPRTPRAVQLQGDLTRKVHPQRHVALPPRTRIRRRQPIEMSPVQKEPEELRLDHLARRLHVVEPTRLELLDHVLLVLRERLAARHQPPLPFNRGPSFFNPSASLCASSRSAISRSRARSRLASSFWYIAYIMRTESEKSGKECGASQKELREPLRGRDRPPAFRSNAPRRPKRPQASLRGKGASRPPPALPRACHAVVRPRAPLRATVCFTDPEPPSTGVWPAGVQGTRVWSVLCGAEGGGGGRG